MLPYAKLILVFRHIFPSPWDVLIPSLSFWEPSLHNTVSPSGSLPRTSSKHSLPDHLVLGLPQACLPRPVGFLPHTAFQTPCCPVPSPVLAAEDEDVETVPLRQGEPVC